MNIKRPLYFLIIILLFVTCLCACRRTVDGTGSSEGRGNGSKANFVETDEIVTVTRENGSGTRGAFVDLFDIEERDEYGNRRDLMSVEAITIQSTAVMMSTVAGNRNAIGYISLGSLNDMVKAIKVNGVEVTAENIKNGNYEIARPFIIATRTNLSDAAQDFVSFIMSRQGQEIVEANGYVSIDHTEDYVSDHSGGRIVVVGSSSVAPIVEKLKEAYEKENKNVVIEIQNSDSAVGMTTTMEGTSDIGMSSRELSEGELNAGLIPTVIALDGIAIIVNNVNPVDNLEREEVSKIFKGEKSTWEGLIPE